MSLLIRLKILIVEDDENTLEEMKKCLLFHARNMNLTIQVIDAVTYQDACTKLHAYNPVVISTSTSYPIKQKAKSFMNSGVELANYAFTKYATIKVVVYGNEHVADITAIFKRFGFMESGKKNLPPIFQKNRNISHDVWAQAVLKVLFER